MQIPSVDNYLADGDVEPSGSPWCSLIRVCRHWVFPSPCITSHTLHHNRTLTLILDISSCLRIILQCDLSKWCRNRNSHILVSNCRNAWPKQWKLKKKLALAHKQICANTCICTNTHTHEHTQTHEHTHTHTHTETHVIQTNMHAYTFTDTNTHTHKHTHKYTYT